ncbi:hypothetical protein, partial [Acinetobacter sp. AGC35]
FFQIILAIIIILTASFYLSDANKLFIFQMIAICLLTVNLRYMLLYILQGTNRIKEYAQITMVDRLLYCGLIIVLLLAGVRDYRILIVADLIGKFISLLFAMYSCKDIVFQRVSTFYFSLRETIENINVGIK